MQGQLSTVVSRVREGADGVATSSSEIAQGNLDVFMILQAVVALRVAPDHKLVVQRTRKVGGRATEKFRQVTYTRGKQRGIKIGEVTYDELPKELVLTVVKDGDKELPPPAPLLTDAA